MLTERLNKRIAEKAELEAELAIEENKKITLTEAQILAFLDYVCEMPADDVNKRRAIINIFVHSIYLYDDHFTLIINASKKPLSIDNIPLDDIETAFEGETGALEGCSSLSAPAPPKIRPSAFGRWPYFWASPARRAGTNLLDGVQEVLPGVVHGVTHVLHGAAHAGLHGPLPG